MTKTITFTELRKIKDSLPDGSMQKIANELNISVETVRNYFGGRNYEKGESCGIHIEPGPQGGCVSIDDTTILDMALDMIEKNK
ncbi:MAG: DNA-binding protein [Dysgonomonas sp.]